MDGGEVHRHVARPRVDGVTAVVLSGVFWRGLGQDLINTLPVNMWRKPLFKSPKHPFIGIIFTSLHSENKDNNPSAYYLRVEDVLEAYGGILAQRVPILSSGVIQPL